MEAFQDEIGGINLPLELTLHLLGLRGVADTIVGSAAVRGVSGGERHRVTTAEMVSGKFDICCNSNGIRLKFQQFNF
jgi:ATP-binding cassette subfamily G (WHITE) protein 2 (SNQ2)